MQIDGERDDLALIDAVLTDRAFRRRTRVARSRSAAARAADARRSGCGRHHGDRRTDCAARRCRGSGTVADARQRGTERCRAPIAPGLYANVRVASSRTIEFGEVVTVDGTRRACVRRRTRTRAEAGTTRASDGATRRTVGHRRGEDACARPREPARSEFTLETSMATEIYLVKVGMTMTEGHGRRMVRAGRRTRRKRRAAVSARNRKGQPRRRRRREPASSNTASPLASRCNPAT